MIICEIFQSYNIHCRLSSQLGPLACQISDKKSQLDEIKNDVFSKEMELIDQMTKLEEFNQKK